MAIQISNEVLDREPENLPIAQTALLMGEVAKIGCLHDKEELKSHCNTTEEYLARLEPICRAAGEPVTTPKTSPDFLEQTPKVLEVAPELGPPYKQQLAIALLILREGLTMRSDNPFLGRIHGCLSLIISQLAIGTNPTEDDGRACVRLIAIQLGLDPPLHLVMKALRAMSKAGEAQHPPLGELFHQLGLQTSPNPQTTEKNLQRYRTRRARRVAEANSPSNR